MALFRVATSSWIRMAAGRAAYSSHLADVHWSKVLSDSSRILVLPCQLSVCILCKITTHFACILSSALWNALLSSSPVTT